MKSAIVREIKKAQAEYRKVGMAIRRVPREARFTVMSGQAPRSRKEYLSMRKLCRDNVWREYLDYVRWSDHQFSTAKLICPPIWERGCKLPAGTKARNWECSGILSFGAMIGTLEYVHDIAQEMESEGMIPPDVRGRVDGVKWATIGASGDRMPKDRRDLYHWSCAYRQYGYWQVDGMGCAIESKSLREAMLLAMASCMGDWSEELREFCDC